MAMRTATFATMLLPLLLASACANAPRTRAHAPPPDAAAAATTLLYDDLGGTAGIERVVDATLAIVHADPHINLFFENSDIPDLRRLLVEQICAASGGPCEYTGRTMEEAHSGMGLTDEDFDRFVADLVAAMDGLAVPKPLQQRLLALLGPMRPEIVGQ
ncbi:MAG: group 1 truncated hemoglobin [Lysobacteraceae bacterium]|jgi:hemoglobin|nr:MAG: group 1 truncated hemoglobin [Xanthomonadaceae bacterium]